MLARQLANSEEQEAEAVKLALAIVALAGCANFRAWVRANEERQAPCWQPCLRRAPATSELVVLYDEVLHRCRCMWVDTVLVPNQLSRIGDALVEPEHRRSAPLSTTKTVVTVERP